MKKYLTFPNVIRLGLACVFLANSVQAFMDPAEFNDLVSASFVASLLPVSVALFVMFVGVSDGLVALLLLTGWRTALVSKYAILWQIGVISVVGVFSLDALEHLGFVAMALSLALSGKNE